VLRPNPANLYGEWHGDWHPLTTSACSTTTRWREAQCPTASHLTPSCTRLGSPTSHLVSLPRISRRCPRRPWEYVGTPDLQCLAGPVMLATSSVVAVGRDKVSPLSTRIRKTCLVAVKRADIVAAEAVAFRLSAALGHDVGARRASYLTSLPNTP
jgi:hypothetical protein